MNSGVISKKKKKVIACFSAPMRSLLARICHQTCRQTGDDLFFFLETIAEFALFLTSKYRYIVTRLRAMTSCEYLRGAFSNVPLCGEKYWRMD